MLVHCFYCQSIICFYYTDIKGKYNLKTENSCIVMTKDDSWMRFSEEYFKSVQPFCKRICVDCTITTCSGEFQYG